MRQLDGRVVTMEHDTIELDVSNARIERVRMWWGERLLSAIANPNLAFLLLMFGFYGILLELYRTIAVISLVLALFALAVLPISYVGLARLLIGLVLLVVEAFVASYGLLAIAGIASLTLGGLMLIDSPAGFLRVSPLIVFPVAPVALAPARSRCSSSGRYSFNSRRRSCSLNNVSTSARILRSTIHRIRKFVSTSTRA